MTTRREYTAGRATTLASAFNIGASTFTIADDGSDATWPTSTDFDFFVTIDAGTAQEERVLCSARSGRIVTVASGGRGKDSTGEKNHSAGATVWPSWSAQDADEANAHIYSTGYASYSKAVHGLGSGDGVVVGTDKAQTLTAKTLASPTITGTITGTGVVSSTNILDGTIVNADIAAGAAIAQSKVDSLTSDLALKAPIANPTFTGTVSGVSKSMVGLGNVDNTSDANKPVSSATTTALGLKLDKAGGTVTGILNVASEGDLRVAGDVVRASVGGTGSAASSGTTSVSHGLGTIPSSVIVTMRTAGTTTGSPRIFYVTAVDSNSFDVRALDTAGVQQSGAFYWIAIA
jgi:hypothetical protein